MFKREISEIIESKLENYDKPILLTGARQVGKTTLVKHIGEKQGKYIYINLEQNENASEIFMGNLIVDDIIISIGIELGINITADHLIIIDEIQSNPRAITSLKYFAEDGKYKVIATGSMLGLVMFTSKSSYPVGKVDALNMYQLSFIEFLDATKNEILASYLRKYLFDGELPQSIHTKALEEFDKYIDLGGYPEVIEKYNSRNYVEAISISESILKAYKADVTKYADERLTSRIHKIYSEIDSMLAGDNQKFRLTKIDNSGYRNLEYPIHWLTNSNIAIITYQLDTPIKPLHAHIRDNQFKLFMNDTGLLMRQSNYRIANIRDKEHIYYGIVIENYIAHVLRKYNDNTYYFQKNSNEIDFLLETVDVVIPIEVKSGTNTKAKSLRAYCDRYKPELALKISKMNYSKNGEVTNIPLYLADLYIEKLVNL